MLNVSLVILLTTPSLYSQWKKPSDKETSLRVFTGNDVLNASWTVNTDDYRSFGFGVEYLMHSLWRYSFEYYGITTREEQVVGAGLRIDECQIAAERAFEFHGLFQRIEFIPRLGIMAAGNLESQPIQNG